MSEKFYMGIDPGQSGGIALVARNGQEPFIFPMPDTEHDCKEIMREFGHLVGIAYIERVHSMPKQGVVSSFKFGMSYGFLRGLLVGLEIPFEEVTPQKWQKEMGCLTHGDKNVSKTKAQQLFPTLAKRITHRTADALLIATWARDRGRRMYGG